VILAPAQNYTLHASTSTAEGAGTHGTVFIQLLVGERWTDERAFFTGASPGEVMSLELLPSEAAEYPTAVRMRNTHHDDPWGMWKLSITAPLTGCQTKFGNYIPSLLPGYDLDRYGDNLDFWFNFPDRYCPPRPSISAVMGGSGIEAEPAVVIAVEYLQDRNVHILARHDAGRTKMLGLNSTGARLAVNETRSIMGLVSLDAESVSNAWDLSTARESHSGQADCVYCAHSVEVTTMLGADAERVLRLDPNGEAGSPFFAANELQYTSMSPDVHDVQTIAVNPGFWVGAGAYPTPTPTTTDTDTSATASPTPPTAVPSLAPSTAPVVEEPQLASYLNTHYRVACLCDASASVLCYYRYGNGPTWSAFPSAATYDAPSCMWSCSPW
jgi:hypothetical protein